MASCKECIHFDRCKGLYKFDRLQKAVSKGCSYFKDRSRFVELPCKLGDTVYFIKGGRVMSDTVIRFVIDRYAVKLTKSNGTDIGYTTQFGERIFLTRKEAEQALRSVIQND